MAVGTTRSGPGSASRSIHRSSRADKAEKMEGATTLEGKKKPRKKRLDKDRKLARGEVVPIERLSVGDSFAIKGAAGFYKIIGRHVQGGRTGYVGRMGGRKPKNLFVPFGVGHQVKVIADR